MNNLNSLVNLNKLLAGVGIVLGILASSSARSEETAELCVNLYDSNQIALGDKSPLKSTCGHFNTKACVKKAMRLTEYYRTHGVFAECEVSKASSPQSQ